MIPIFYSISVHIIKSNAARIDRQDDRKGLIAVDIDHLNGAAVLDLKLLHLLLTCAVWPSGSTPTGWKSLS